MNTIIWRKVIFCGLLLLSVVLQAISEDLEGWQERAFNELYVKYLGTSPPGVKTVQEHRKSLDRLFMKVGERLAASGLSGVPAEDIATLALLQVRSTQPPPSPQSAEPSVAASPVDSHPEKEKLTSPVKHTDVIKGNEGLQQAQERLAQLPISERMVFTGDVVTMLQAATVPGAPELTSTIGRARLNVVLRTLPATQRRGLGEGYFMVQMVAAGGPPDSSSVGGPSSFSPFNDIATDRSRFNELTSRGNLYLGRVFYEQRIGLGENYLIGRAGIIDLSDYFDTNLFANNEARQFVNSSFVNSAAYKAAISAPGVMAAYHRRVKRDWLEGVVVRAGYAVSRTDRAFTSPIWMGELELQTRLQGHRGNWRFGGSVGNRADVGSVRGLHISLDHWITPRIGLFGRYGVANASMGSLSFGPVRQSYSGGVQVRFVDSQDRVSAWSLGFSQAYGIITDAPLSSERILETYYRWQWTQNFALSPDFQFILGSGGRLRQGNQAVLGLRFNFTF